MFNFMFLLFLFFSVQDLADLLGADWMKVGRFLGIPSQKLQVLRNDNSGNLSETIVQMLLGWREDAGFDATFTNLAKALKKRLSIAWRSMFRQVEFFIQRLSV